MILLLKHGATDTSVREVVDAVSDLGLSTMPLDDARGKALEVLGADPSRVLGLRGLAAVEEILTRRTPLQGGEPVWPHFLLRVLILVLLLLAGLALLSAFAPVGLGDRAASSLPPGPLHLEWYLRPLAGLRDLLGSKASRIVTGLFWILFFAWPFLDRSDSRRARILRRVMGLALIALLLALGLR